MIGFIDREDNFLIFVGRVFETVNRKKQTNKTIHYENKKYYHCIAVRTGFRIQ